MVIAKRTRAWRSWPEKSFSQHSLAHMDHCPRWSKERTNLISHWCFRSQVPSRVSLNISTMVIDDAQRVLWRQLKLESLSGFYAFSPVATINVLKSNWSNYCERESGGDVDTLYNCSTSNNTNHWKLTLYQVLCHDFIWSGRTPACNLFVWHPSHCSLIDGLVLRVALIPPFLS